MTVDQSTLRRGIYRWDNPGGMESDAMVEDVNGGSAMHLPESLYRARGYQPPFEELPLRDVYLAQQQVGDNA